jgi:hypothetical protein
MITTIDFYRGFPRQFLDLPPNYHFNNISFTAHYFFTIKLMLNSFKWQQFKE